MVEVGRQERRRTSLNERPSWYAILAGAERHPRVGRPLVRTAGAQRDLRDHDLLPAGAAGGADAAHEPAGAAVRPPILLPQADEVARVQRVDGEPRASTSLFDRPSGLARTGRHPANALVPETCTSGPVTNVAAATPDETEHADEGCDDCHGTASA